MPLTIHKQAVIVTYNDTTDKLLEKPFRVMPENVKQAIENQKKKYAARILNGERIMIEYDLLHFTSKRIA